MLRTHGYFKTIATTRSDEWDPIPIYVQRVAKAPRNQARAVAQFFGPWLQELTAILRRDTFDLLDLAPDPTRPIVPLVILASRGDYENYLRTRANRGWQTTWGTYDETVHAVIAYLETSGSRRAEHTRRFTALSDYVLGELEARGLKSAGAPHEIWFTEGFAAYLAFHLGREPNVLAQHVPYRQALESLGGILRRPEWMAELWLSFEDLIALQSYGALARLATDREQVDGLARARTYWMFEAQTALWLHFLHEGEERMHQQSTWEYLKLVLRGEGGLEAFLRVYGVADLAGFERTFEEYVARLYAAEFLSGSPDAERAPEVAASEPVLPEAPFDPAELAVAPEDIRHVLAAMLWAARAGDAEGAAAVAGEWTAGGSEGSDRSSPRLVRAQRRLRALIDTRDAYLAELAADGGKLRLTVDGERLNLRVESVRNGTLHFKRSSSGLTEWSVRAFSAADLAANMGRRAGELGPEWLRGYLVALAGGDKWRRYAKGEGEEQRDLVRDVESDFAELLALGTVMARLNMLSRLPVPDVPVDAEHTLAALAQLLQPDPLPAIVATRKARLRTFARTALEVLFETRGLDEIMHTNVERLDDGRIRLVYEFDDPREAWDFVEDEGYLASGLRKAILDGAESPPSTFGIRAGGLRGKGATCYRHLLGFAAPVAVRYLVSHNLEASNASGAYHLIGIDDDARGSFVALYGFGLLQIRDIASRDFRDLGTQMPMPFYGNVPYRMEITQDEQGNVVTRVDDVVRGEGVTALRAGRVFLWLHSGYMLHFDRLEIEGRLDRESSKVARDGWIATQLAEMRLGD